MTKVSGKLAVSCEAFPLEDELKVRSKRDRFEPSEACNAREAFLMLALQAKINILQQSLQTPYSWSPVPQ